MKATDKKIRLKPLGYIKYTLMRASADQDTFSLFLYKQIMLVQKIIGNKFSINIFIKSEGA